MGELNKEYNPEPLKGECSLVVTKTKPSPKVNIKFKAGKLSIEKILIMIYKKEEVKKHSESIKFVRKTFSE